MIGGVRDGEEGAVKLSVGCLRYFRADIKLRQGLIAGSCESENIRDKRRGTVAVCSISKEVVSSEAEPKAKLGTCPGFAQKRKRSGRGINAVGLIDVTSVLTFIERVI